ncbi:hypothetical protein [Sulfobacillus thermosulfidooxidans]|uniref:hypothetical protein n=1 Tax=Sulfobacillus thermosulfidooxidans TaxID=28034 RepID=UPI0002D26170|nr:hypothetical protein [Sulfobacillus thermosulfidooxidans]
MNTNTLLWIIVLGFIGYYVYEHWIKKSQQSQQNQDQYAQNAAASVGGATSNSSSETATESTTPTLNNFTTGTLTTQSGEKFRTTVPTIAHPYKTVGSTDYYHAKNGSTVKIHSVTSLPQWQVNTFGQIQAGTFKNPDYHYIGGSPQAQLTTIEKDLLKQYGNSKYADYTGYVHVNLGGGNFSDVYVQNGQAYGEHL